MPPAPKEAVSELSKYGLTLSDPNTDPKQITYLLTALKRLPPPLVKDCDIKSMGFEDLGPSSEYYPNHGYYAQGIKYLVLNTQLDGDPNLYKDDNGPTMDRFQQTLYHELGHGYDASQGNLSEQKEWLNLSGWSQDPKKGLYRITIDDKESPTLVGEWCYDPSAGFPRFYAKRNPWDDFADSFSFYVAGLKGFLPKNKIRYFDEKLGKYYGKKAADWSFFMENAVVPKNIISKNLYDLVLDLKGMGQDRLANDVSEVWNDIRIAEDHLDVPKDLGKILQEKDKDGVPVLFYLLQSGELTPEVQRQLKSLAPNALKTPIPLEKALKLCRQASMEVSELIVKNSKDEGLFRKLTKLSDYIKTAEVAIEEKIKKSPTPTQIELRKQELLPKQVKNHINDLKNHAQSLLRSRGKDGLGDFMKSFKNVMELRHKLENPTDPIIRTPVGPTRSLVKNPQIEQVKKDIQEQKEEKQGPQKSETQKSDPGAKPGVKRTLLERGKAVVDRFKKKPKDPKETENKAETKLTPDRPAKPSDKKEDKKPLPPLLTPDRPTKPAEKKEEKKVEKAEEPKKPEKAEAPHGKSLPPLLTPDRPPKTEKKEDGKATEKDVKDLITPDRPVKPKDKDKDKLKEKMKGTQWETNYTWEDFAKLSSEEQKEVTAYFDATADRLQGFGQKAYAKRIDEITNKLEAVASGKKVYE